MQLKLKWSSQENQGELWLALFVEVVKLRLSVLKVKH